MPLTLAAVALGGALGSVARYLLANFVQTSSGRPFPLGTLSVNVIGSFVIGLLYVWLVERSAHDSLRAFWIVGILGGFTTFSSFSLETFNLLAQGAYGKALLNVALSVVLCLTATALGFLLARQF